MWSEDFLEQQNAKYRGRWQRMNPYHPLSIFENHLEQARELISRAAHGEQPNYDQLHWLRTLGIEESDFEMELAECR